MKPMYCITHESWLYDPIEQGFNDDCLFTTSAPPELPDNWELIVTEPSPEELMRIDLNAEELLMDVIGAGL